MAKLNFGCGSRISPDWINIDFHGTVSGVQRVNLLAGFPFEDSFFDAVYSSHVLEHFTPSQALFLMNESYRVLKPNGILRTVVPNLEGTCREYISILGMPDSNPEKQEKYEWILIELLDQLVRSTPGGTMGPFYDRVLSTGNKKLITYVRSRTENALWEPREKKTYLERLKGFTLQKFSTKLIYLYLRCIASLIPGNLRSMVFVATGLGERHRWMYDSYSLKGLYLEVGFRNVEFLRYDISAIPHFNEDCLDSNSDGTSYKNNSVYCEAIK
ncbi:MAG: class I SAM-dependent methyltransferase [Methylocella sp.]